MRPLEHGDRIVLPLPIPAGLRCDQIGIAGLRADRWLGARVEDGGLDQRIEPRQRLIDEELLLRLPGVKIGKAVAGRSRNKSEGFGHGIVSSGRPSGQGG